MFLASLLQLIHVYKIADHLIILRFILKLQAMLFAILLNVFHIHEHHSNLTAIWDKIFIIFNYL